MKEKIITRNIENDKSDWRLYKGKDNIRTMLAKKLAKSPKDLQDYKRHTIKEFTKNKELYILLLNLKTIAMAEAIAELAKNPNMKRPNAYRKNNNPSVEKLIEIANDLGITRISKAA